MLNTQDQQTLTKASHSAIFLVRHLDELVKSSNPLLAEIARDTLSKATQIDEVLQRIDSATQDEEKSA